MKKEKVESLHPFLALSTEIEEHGIVVLDNVDRLPVYGEPFVSTYLVLALIHSGSTRGEFDMMPIEVCAHDLSVVYPNHTVVVDDSSEDYRATIIIVSGNFYSQMQRRITYGRSKVFFRQTKFHLSDAQYKCFYDAVCFLKSISKMDIEHRNELVADVMDMLSHLADEFWQMSNSVTEKLSGRYGVTPHSCFNRFYECLANHYLESREVRFYARKLNFSPKYFGNIIKEETGVSAGKWIANYVVVRAKTMLRQFPDLTIQQICHMVGFSDAASFSRYFKANAGMTAKEYKKQVVLK